MICTGPEGVARDSHLGLDLESPDPTSQVVCFGGRANVDCNLMRKTINLGLQTEGLLKDEFQVYKIKVRGNENMGSNHEGTELCVYDADCI